MKTFQLSIEDIPRFWENIKFACTEADEVPKESLPGYLNELLYSLLSDKAQCFVRVDDDKTLIALILVRIKMDAATGKKYLFNQCFYSWKKLTLEEWIPEMTLGFNFAKKEGCESIVIQTRNQKIIDLITSFGFTERFRTYSVSIKGR